jgi:hypothetical protein
MYKANLDTYKEDNLLLGIKENQRPIMIMVKMDSRLENTVNTININNQIKEKNLTEDVKIETVEPLINNEIKSVLSKKDTTIVETIDRLAKGKLKVYIQYSDKSKESKVNEFANQLKEYYVIPPIDFVENKSGYKNEIRYYRPSDKTIANELSERIKKITGITFKTKNINQYRIKNTIEVWFNSEESIKKPFLQPKN